MCVVVVVVGGYRMSDSAADMVRKGQDRSYTLSHRLLENAGTYSDFIQISSNNPR